MIRNLLTETLTWDEAKILVEGGGRDEKGKEKDLYMTGIFLQGEVRNHNNRIYPVHEIRKAVNQINECIRRGETVWGEADHPDTLKINLERVSHMIISMWMEGNNGYGKLKILPTPLGNICRVLLESGGKLGVSSRGSGNVNEYTGYVSDFEIITVDIVARPSAPNAYPKVVYERRIYDVFNSKRGNIVYDLSNSVNYDRRAYKYLKKEILNWMNTALK
ncbi:MAG: hypothetical protein QXF12_05795 [Candidatus Aenigmatarchaeota archaeon]